MLALVCGDACIWKPSAKAPLVAIAMTNACRPVLEREGLGALCSLVIGGHEAVGQHLVGDKRVPLLSFTGSTQVGRDVASRLATRYARAILECGGNNAIVLMDDFPECTDVQLAPPFVVRKSEPRASPAMTSWLVNGSTAIANNADRGWFGSGLSATHVESGCAATTTGDPAIATTHSARIVARRRWPNSDTSLPIITS